MKAYCGSGGLTPRILTLGTRWKWVVSFTPRTFYPWGKSTWYRLDRRLGGPQSQSRRGGEVPASLLVCLIRSAVILGNPEPLLRVVERIQLYASPRQILC